MQPFLDLVGHLEGRDKLTKLCQYSSRGLAFVILTADPKSVLGQRLSALYKATQAARKCFRIGKSITYVPKIDATLNNKEADKEAALIQANLVHIPGVRIPERLLGKKLNDGIIGVLGCISASVFLHSLWQAQSLQRGPKNKS
ncbi:hypothetical protein DYB37_000846 [Aphanomyces astaci]|uniref:Uncharacterized protein n=2 Tax=Aphanomyces astaci TaxID=112090 RepID=A0A3R6ZLQ8_APHAT|nr:hypothetical protein DYB35_000495 [Aphanomyces astaci]RHZ21194.1 hypothetical protein DYB37_000846 [Aphanomyces astaci]